MAGAYGPCGTGDKAEMLLGSSHTVLFSLHTHTHTHTHAHTHTHTTHTHTHTVGYPQSPHLPRKMLYETCPKLPESASTASSRVTWLPTATPSGTESL